MKLWVRLVWMLSTSALLAVESVSRASYHLNETEKPEAQCHSECYMKKVSLSSSAVSQWRIQEF